MKGCASVLKTYWLAPLCSTCQTLSYHHQLASPDSMNNKDTEKGDLQAHVSNNCISKPQQTRNYPGNPYTLHHQPYSHHLVPRIHSLSERCRLWRQRRSRPSRGIFGRRSRGRRSRRTRLLRGGGCSFRLLCRSRILRRILGGRGCYYKGRKVGGSKGVEEVGCAMLTCLISWDGRVGCIGWEGVVLNPAE